MSIRGIPGKLLGMTAMLVVLTMVTSLAPRQVAAADASFESPEYGFTIDWDDNVWTGEEVELEGDAVAVAFDSVSSWGQVQALPYEVEDPETCLEGMIDIFADDDGEQIDNYGVAPVRMDRVEPVSGSASELMTYTFLGENGNDIDLVMFLSCTPLLDGDAALEIFITTTADVYEDVMLDWDDLVAGVSVGEGTGIEEASTKRGDVGDGSYEDAELGFSFAWDPEAWDSAVIEVEGVSGVELFGEVSYAYIAATVDTGLESNDECLDALADTFVDGRDIDDLRSAPSRADRPEANQDAASKLLTFTDPKNDEKSVIYNECRVDENGTAFYAQFIAAFDLYQDDLLLWQETLDSITIGEQSASNDQSSRDRDGVVDGVITSPNYGIEVTYDADIWTASDETDGELDHLVFDSEFGQAQLTAVETNETPEECLDIFVESEGQFATEGVETASSRFDRPENSEAEAAELIAYTYESENGPVDALVYIECGGLDGGDGLYALKFSTTEEIWGDAMPVIDELIAGVEA